MIKIFIEAGKPSTSEYVFIKTLVTRILDIDSGKFKIECVDGKDNLDKAANIFKTNSEEGGINLIVFDADFPANKGGFKVRQEFLQQRMAELGIEAELFLFPNHNDDGDFEYLLEQLTQSERHKLFFDCFGDYETCLGSNYLTPNRRGKLHTYISAMPMSKTKRDKLGQGEWQFENTDYWDLNKPYLDPLKEFFLHWIK